VETYDVVDDFVGFVDAAELVDVPAGKGAAGEGTGLSEHGADFLYAAVGDVKAFTAVGGYLVAKVATQ
jgi:hypothetical protein